MAYYRRRIVTGAVVEVEKWQTYAGRKEEKKPRAPKSRPTPEEMFVVNERNAAIKLRRKINTHFGPGDFHLILDYHASQRPDAAESRIRLEKFLRALRSCFKGLARELKYIAVTEHLRTNIHHHLVIPSCDIGMLQKIWTSLDASHWRVKVFPLDDSGQYRVLAEYLIKETSRTFRDGTGAYRKRWCESRNLQVDIPKAKRIKARQWRTSPQPEKGYYIESDSIENGTNPYTGLAWQKYSMVRVPVRGRASVRKNVNFAVECKANK